MGFRRNYPFGSFVRFLESHRQKLQIKKNSQLTAKDFDKGSCDPVAGEWMNLLYLHIVDICQWWHGDHDITGKPDLNVLEKGCCDE